MVYKVILPRCSTKTSHNHLDSHTKEKEIYIYLHYIKLIENVFSMVSLILNCTKMNIIANLSYFSYTRLKKSQLVLLQLHL